ncbi:MAG: insulinase family protein [Planctomycetes bacterium]|nr:insulinase family protein [Planctomycetota bacterium]
MKWTTQRTRGLVVAGVVGTGTLFLAAVGPVARAGDLDLPAQEKTLENGLKIVVLEDHSIPNCAINIWWRVGSRNEHVGATGLAHFFEHMMFMGGAKYGDQFDVVMESQGGSNNAFTTFDNTTYQDWFPTTGLPLILDMERDRMSGMVFSTEKVEHEREVVHSEYRGDMEDPGARLNELFRATAYTSHPYQWDVLGWEADIKNWKQSDLEEFYTANYAPNNATLVLVGDVKAAEAFAEIEKALGAIPRKAERRPIHTIEPEQKGERRVVLEDANASLPQALCGWHICKTDDPDFPVLEVIEDILLDGESSRLNQALVEAEGLCLGVGGGWQGHQFDASLFTVELTMRDGLDTATGERRAYEEIAKLAKDGPTDRELRRVKNKNRAEFVRRLQTIDGKAAILGETDLFFGGWKNLSKRIERIEAVTADDVKRVTAKVFTQANRTVATLVNPTKTLHGPAKAAGGHEDADEDDEDGEDDEMPEGAKKPGGEGR